MPRGERIWIWDDGACQAKQVSAQPDAEKDGWLLSFDGSFVPDRLVFDSEIAALTFGVALVSNRARHWQYEAYRVNALLRRRREQQGKEEEGK